MRAVVREDELEDLVGTTSQTFLGLTATAPAATTTNSIRSRKSIITVFVGVSGVRHGEREILAAEGKADADVRSHALDGEASD